MSIPSSITPLFSTGSSAAAAPVQIERSLRFNSSDSAFLSRTPAVAGNRRTWTWAGWVKVSKQQEYPDQKGLFFAGSSNSNLFRMMFQGSSGQLRIDNDANGSNVTVLLTTQVFRDFSAWMHIILAVDTTQTTPSNRFKIYVNGTQITTFSTATYQAQNTDTLVNSTNAHSIGNLLNHSPIYYFDGYLADIHFIDGQALDATAFTEVSATTGQLIPKAYTGSFGTNGFWLKFSDNSAATAAALGNDYSGNNNDWTPNNLSVTAGAGNDSLVDTPTSYGTDTSGVGGVVRGNYATFNAIDKNSGLTLQNGNLYGTTTTTAHQAARGTIGVSSGKWYWEVTLDAFGAGNTAFTIGIGSNASSLSNTPGADITSYGWYSDGGGGSLKSNNGSSSSYGTVIANGVVVGVALDLNAGTIVFYRNNTSQGTAYSSIPANTYFPMVAFYNASGTANFGQRAFAYTAPSGFKALCDTNLPEGTITTSGSYTGNGVADGPFIYLNGIPTAMTVGGNAVTFGTHADKLSNGFKLRTTSTTYNQNALSYNYSITTTGAKFKYARAQPNP